MKRCWLLILLLILVCPAAAQEATLEPDVTLEVTAESTAAAESARITEEGVYTVREVYDQRVRTYLLTVTEAALANAPAPLVFVLHGAGGSAETFNPISGWEAVAVNEGIIVVHANGVDSQWNDGRPGGVPADDVAWIAHVVDTVASMVNIDRSRVYTVGYSMGGMMSLRLACALAEVITGAASVASTMPLYFLGECEGSPPVPVLFMHGTDDNTVPWIGIRNTYLPALASAAYWAQHNACGEGGDLTALDDRDPQDGTRVILQQFTACENGADVALYGIFGGGHTYPGHQMSVNIGLGRTTMDIEAASTIWLFFEDHRREG